MESIYFTVLIGIVLFGFFSDQFLDYLNYSWFKKEIPELLQGIYSEEKYAKSQNYKSERYKFSIITSIFSTILIMFMFYFNGFAFVNTIAYNLSSNPVFVTILFFGILMFASDIINTPFSMYSIFVIEQKYGFNKTTLKTFLSDKLKSYIIGIILGGGILALIVWFYQQLGETFWIAAWIVVTVFSVFMSMFYSQLIVPLFNKQTPLEDGKLKNAIQDFCHNAGFKLTNVYVIDGSKRSTKANAYFTGLGSKKRIVLYDTLIKDLSVNEIVAVLAHEIGHYKKKHTLTGMVAGVIQTGIMLYILSLFLNNPQLSGALGVDEPNFHISLVAFGILYSPVSTITGLFMNILSRKNEYEADAFAASFNLGDNLIQALKKLSVNNLSNLTPHPAYVFMHYSHPPLYQRMVALLKQSNK